MSGRIYRSDLLLTARRKAALARYFGANVMGSGAFICAAAGQCRASHRGDYYPAQLHHVGRHYDLIRDREPVRIVVVGQEYGHGPAFVSLDDRYEMVVKRSGLESHFRRDAQFQARNPHMRGCTNLLRLILGLGLGVDHDGEFLNISGARVHIFDCFALVNFLLCSAVPARNGATPATVRLGGRPGRSTRTMQANCARHFRAALEILEPTLVIAQGYGVRSWIAAAFGLPARRPQDGLEPLRLRRGVATLVSFSHPSAHGRLNWGMNERMPYLLNTVAPTIARVMGGPAAGCPRPTAAANGGRKRVHSDPMPIQDPDYLRAALVGFQQRIAEIDTRMADLRQKIHGRAPMAAAPASAPAKKKRRLSPEGRARIIAATKKRWAAVRKAKAAKKAN